MKRYILNLKGLKMKKTLILSMTTWALLSSTPLIADEITTQITEGLKAYKEKDYKGAIEELKFAMAQLEELKKKKNSQLLPLALEGWTAKAIKDDGEAAAMAMFGMGAGSSMKSLYSKGKEKIIIEVVANSPLLAIINMSINNPAMLTSQKGMKVYRYKRIKGMKKTEENKIEITLVLSGQIMIKITGENLKNEATLEKYLDVIDMKKLKEELL